jgi:hypothetical protein
MRKSVVKTRMEEHGQPICQVPWNNLILSFEGTVRCCCYATGGFGQVGVDGETIMDVWNSERAQEFRQNMLDGQVHRICTAHCQEKSRGKGVLRAMPRADGDPRFEANITLLQEEFEEGKTRLESIPPLFELQWSNRCNYRCVMCVVVRSHKTFTDYDLRAEEMDRLYPYIYRLNLLGGEPLVEKTCIEFIEKFTKERHANGTLNLMTNGMLLDHDMLKRFEKTRFHGIGFSVDAVTKETYETIRKGGDFDTVVKNMKGLAAFRRSAGLGFRMTMNFLAMNLNFRELPRLPAFVRGLDDDFGLRINPARHLPEYMLENHPELHGELHECLEQLEIELAKYGFPKESGQTQVKNILGWSEAG